MEKKKEKKMAQITPFNSPISAGKDHYAEDIAAFSTPLARTRP
jgi:hypothetical protein